MPKVEIEFSGHPLWSTEEFRQGIEAINKGPYPKYRAPEGSEDKRFAVSLFGRWMDKGKIYGCGKKVEVRDLRLGRVLGKLYSRNPHPRLENNRLVFEWKKE